MKNFKTTILGVVLAASSFSLSAQQYMPSENTPVHIRAAVESSERSAEDSARDATRRPAEVLTLADLNEGDHIIELSALGQYYSTIISAAIGSEGQLDMYDLPPWSRFGADENGNAFADSHANTDYTIEFYHQTSYAENVDAVYNINSYHDLLPTGVETEQMNDLLFAALKPGGKYLIIDHRAPDGSDWSDSEELHRIDPALVIEEVTAAGFELLTESALLSNPDDDNSTPVFGIEGPSDRLLLIFRKPN
ncbi:MAG: SAM-dependent methyltransferase [Gammaproteobacteria bacterium]|nr:SAM-dependent methyltransferase [Gammaproteobacteria bacterium]